MAKLLELLAPSRHRRGPPVAPDSRGNSGLCPGGEGYRIGPWQVEPATGQLRHRDGKEQHLRPQEMDLLSCLADAAGRVVSREEILAAVWDDAAVEEGAITRCVSKVRKALDDPVKAPRYIETIPKRGYRLIQPVEQMSAESGPEKPRPSVRRSLIAAAAGVLMVLAAATCWPGRDPRPSKPTAIETPRARPEAGAPGPAAEERPVVAVLGFADLADGGEADWLSTALAEMLATELASARELRVVGGETVSLMKRELSLTTSESLAPTTLRRIRASLGADLVVVGSYLLQDGVGRRELRLDLTLQDTATGETVSGLAESGALDRLGELVSTTGVRLRERLGAAAPDRSWSPPASHLPKDSEVVRLYAEGLGKLRRFETVAARDLLLEAVAREPHQPLAHLALAEAWKALGHDARSADAARRANRQRTELSRELQLWIEASYLATLRRRDGAIDLYDALWLFVPENLEYGLRLARTQNAASRPADALETVERIRRRAGTAHRDPRLELITAEATRLLGDHDRSLAASATAIELGEALVAPSVVARGRLYRALALHALGRVPEAITALEQARVAFAAAGDRRSEAGARQHLAGWLTVKGEFERAEELATASLTTYRDIGDRSGEAAALRAIAELKWRTGDPIAAETALRESMEIFREIADRTGEAAALGSLGVLAGSQRRLPAAAKYFGEALALHREAGKRSSVASVLTNLGKLHLLEASPVEADVYLREAESLSRELGLVNNLADVRFNQGYSAWLRGDPGLGEAAFSESIELYRRLENPLMTDASLQGLGEIHLLRGELESARTYIEEALAGRLEIFREEGGAAISTMESRATLSAVLFELGHFDAAERTAREAVETSRHPRALTALAQVLLEDGRGAEARELSVEAGELLRNQESVSDVVLRHRTLAARIQATLGDLEGARGTLAQVKADAKVRGAWTLYAEAEICLGEIEIHSGDHGAGDARLAAVEAEARAREVHLLADKARQARSGSYPQAREST